RVLRPPGPVRWTVRRRPSARDASRLHLIAIRVDRTTHRRDGGWDLSAVLARVCFLCCAAAAVLSPLSYRRCAACVVALPSSVAAGVWGAVSCWRARA